jgi:phosphatidylinositol alpha-mannosyltransferase
VKYLFRAVTKVARTTRRRIRVIVVGNDELRRHLLPRLPSRVDVCFVGVVGRDLLPRYFASGDVFCAPAVDRESFGIVLLEAMASGIPVVGSSIPGYLNILADRWNSLVVPPKDPSSLCAAIVEVMDDPRLRAKLRENGIRTVDRYRWDRIAARLEQIYTNGNIGKETSPLQEVVRPAPAQVQKA